MRDCNPALLITTLWELWGKMHQAADERIANSQRLEDMIASLDEVQVECERFGLREAAQEIKDIKRFNVPGAKAEHIALLVAKAITKVQRESMDNDFVKIDFEDRGFYEGEPLSREAASAFPSARRELKDAGKCYALGQYTACVFHAMRAMEGGLGALADDLGVRLRYPNHLADWYHLIHGCEVKIKKMENLPKTAKKSEDLKFYSSAASQFFYFKEAWRNHVMHGRGTYNRTSAKEILEHVRIFVESLSGRLTEKLLKREADSESMRI